MRWVAITVLGLLLGLVLLVRFDCPGWLGAAMILRAFRVPAWPTSLPHEDFRLTTDDGLVLRGWLFRPQGTPRGLVVYLHGRDGNRGKSARFAERLVPQGLAVLAYDGRANGLSGGRFMTYGAREVPDLRRAIEQVGITPVYLVGESLGAAVALEEAAEDPRVAGVAAAAAYADLTSRIRETAERLHTHPVEASMAEAERLGGFHFADCAPIRSAARIQAPVLLVHGARDNETPVHHAQELLAALPGPKALRIFEGVGHGDILRHAKVRQAIVDWLLQLAAVAPARH